MATEAASPNSFALTDVRIFTGERFIPSGHVVVTNGRITAVGEGAAPASATTKDVPVLSKPNHTVIPGLIDAHIHADHGRLEPMQQSLLFGVTTVCDMHNELHHVRRLRKLAQDPTKYNIYADYKTCGVAATIPGGWPEWIVTAHDPREETKQRIQAEWPQLTSPAEAADYVAAQVSEGATYIKLMHEDGHALKTNIKLPAQDLQKAIISAAHARGLRTVAHALSYAATKDILECGVDGLAHTFVDKAIQAEIVDLYKERFAHCCPTLSTLGSLTAETKPLLRRFADDPLAVRMLPAKTLDAFTQSLGMSAGAGTLANAIDSVAVLHRAGVPILAGSDAAGPVLGATEGLTIHQEIHMFVSQAKMEPVEALKTATMWPARRFGMEDRGTIEEGKNADLVLCEGDVESFLRDKGLCLPIRGVWRNGVVAEAWKQVMA